MVAIVARPMRLILSDSSPAATDADLLCIGLFKGEALPDEFASAPGSADVRTRFKALSMLRPDRPERVLVIGLGDREDFDAERARVAGALASRQAKRFEATSLAWICPEHEIGASAAAGLTAGTILGSYRFERLKSGRRDSDDGRAMRTDRIGSRSSR